MIKTYMQLSLREKEVSIILVTGSHSIRAVVLFAVENLVDGWDRVVRKNVVKFRGVTVT